jgi:hypothetical protein
MASIKAPLPCRYQARDRPHPPPSTWKRSLDDRLTDYGQGRDLDGYVWGVQWQELYPGMRLVPDSAEARRWTDKLGIPFREAVITMNAHVLTLVFSDLTVDVIDPGHTPFAVPSGGPNGKIPFRTARSPSSETRPSSPVAAQFGAVSIRSFDDSEPRHNDHSVCGAAGRAR